MIRINTRGLDQLKQKISELPHGTRGIATAEASKYLIGNERRGLQHYPSPPSGSTYQRTYKLRFGWRVNSWDAGTKTVIVNDVEYAPYVQGDNSQAWMHQGRWKTVSDVIQSNMQGAMKAVNDAVARWLKAKGW
jgi:DNA-binding beta-propeller fold protein YncE